MYQRKQTAYNRREHEVPEIPDSKIFEKHVINSLKKKKKKSVKILLARETSHFPKVEVIFFCL